MSKELKDFVSAFTAGYKLWDDAEFNKARTEWYQERTRQLKAGKSGKDDEYESAATRFGARPGGTVSAGSGDAGSVSSDGGPGKYSMNEMVSAAKEAGFEPYQAKAVIGEVGRENGFQQRYIFGAHTDAANGKQNVGLISWQGPRNAAFMNHMKEAGYVDENGKLIPSREALTEQFRYLKKEINTDPAYAKTKQVFNDPSATPTDLKNAFQSNYIRWNPKVDTNGAARRDAYTDQADRALKAGAAPPAPTAVPVPTPRPPDNVGDFEKPAPASPVLAQNFENPEPQDPVEREDEAISAPDASSYDFEPTARTGGMIPAPRYAIGGPVKSRDDDEEDDDEEGDDEDDDIGYRPSKVAVDDSNNAYWNAEAAAGRGPPSIGEVVRGGMSYLQDAFKLAPNKEGVPTPDPERDKRIAAFNMGLGSTDDATYKEVEDRIDPDRELPPGQRHMMALKRTYQFFAEKGDLTRAKKAASELLQYGRIQSAEIADELLREKDPQKRAALAQKMYGFMPDGNDVQIQMDPSGAGRYSVVGSSGKVVSQGQFTPQQFMAAALGMKNGTAYWSEMTRIAGQQEKDATPTGPSEGLQKLLLGLEDRKGDEEPPLADATALGRLSTAEQLTYKRAYSAAREKWLQSHREANTRQKAADKEAADKKSAEDTVTANRDLRQQMAVAADLAEQINALPAEPRATKNGGKDLAAWKTQNEALLKDYAKRYYAISDALHDRGESLSNIQKILESEKLGQKPYFGRNAVKDAPVEMRPYMALEEPAPKPAPAPAPVTAIPPAGAAPQQAPQQAIPPAGAAPQQASPQPAAPQLKPPPPDTVAKAKAAIAKGADPAKVKAYLQQNGFSSEGL